MPSPANTASKLGAYFESRSLIRNRKLPLPVRSKDRFLPCWATQAESGFLAAPAKWTRLVWSSITKEHVQGPEPDGLDGEEVGPRIPCAWLRRHSPQVGPDRRGAGPSPLRRKSVRIAIAETLIPSLTSSPRIRTHPQRGFSLPIRRISSRTSSPSGGPRRWRSDGRSTSCGRARGAGAGASVGSLTNVQATLAIAAFFALQAPAAVP